MIRAFKIQLESKADLDSTMDHLVFEWLVEWSVTAINQYKLGQDGKTAYERVRGHKFRKSVAICG